MKMRMSKLDVGQTVYLFNSISLKIEEDQVYGILYVPEPVEGREQHPDKSFAERIESGEQQVVEKVQTLQHQIVDAAVLFESEEECVAFYRDFFKADE